MKELGFMKDGKVVTDEVVEKLEYYIGCGTIRNRFQMETKRPGLNASQHSNTPS